MKLLNAAIPGDRVRDFFIIGLLFLAILQLPASVSSNGHDAGSQAAYEWWTLHGFAYGKDIIQNVGPLGFLSYPTLYTGFLDAPKLLINLFLTGSLIFLLWDRSKSLSGVIRIVFLISAMLFAVGDVMFYLLLLLVSHQLMFATRLRTVFFAISILALLALAKGSYFFIALFIVAVTVVNCTLSRRFVLGVAMIAGFFVFLMALWILAGQSPADFWAFAYGMASFSSGYNEAMAIFEPPHVQAAGFVALLGSALPIFWRALGSLRDIRLDVLQTGRQALLSAVEFFVLFVVWKHGFVRADVHISIFFCYVLVSHIWILFRREPLENGPTSSRLNMPLMLSRPLWFVLAVASFVGLRAVHPIAPIAGIAPIGGFYKIHDNLLRIINIPRLYRELRTRLEKNVAGMQLPKTRALVGMQSIGYFGIFPAPMVYNGFNYVSSPSTISFASWSDRIMKTDAAFYRDDSRAPTYLLFDLKTIDNRLAAQDNSLAQLEILHRYELVGEEGSNIILHRVKGKEPLLPTLISQLDYKVGDWAVVPQHATRPMWVKIDIEKIPLSYIAALAYKPAGYFIEILHDNGAKKAYRLIPQMAANGFLIDPLINSNNDNLVVRSREEFDHVGNDSHPGLSKVVRFRIACYKHEVLCGERATVTFEEIHGLAIGDRDFKISKQH